MELAVAVVLGTAFTDLIASATKVRPRSWSPGVGRDTIAVVNILSTPGAVEQKSWYMTLAIVVSSIQKHVQLCGND